MSYRSGIEYNKSWIICATRTLNIFRAIFVCVAGRRRTCGLGDRRSTNRPEVVSFRRRRVNESRECFFFISGLGKMVVLRCFDGQGSLAPALGVGRLRSSLKHTRISWQTETRKVKSPSHTTQRDTACISCCAYTCSNHVDNCTYKSLSILSVTV